jgi:diguanylate cyclase (GGDEF)-like protein/PAS domain S-box-containing protein
LFGSEGPTGAVQILSLVILVVTAAWSVQLWLAGRDRRLLVPGAVIVVVLLSQLVMLAGDSDGPAITLRASDLPLLGASVLALLLVLRSRRTAPRSPGANAARPVAGVGDSQPAAIGIEKAVETMQLGVTITDLAGKIVYSNPADARMHGFQPGELEGQDVRVFAGGGTSRQMSAAELEAMRSWRRETTNRRRDGTAFPVHLMSDVVRNRRGDLIGVVTTCEDITQRKNAEAALKESEERYALAALGANDGLWDWNVTTGAVHYSARWATILGCEPAEIGATLEEWLSRVHPEDLVRVRTELTRHVEGRSPHFESEHRLRHKDGSYRWVLARGLAVRSDRGEATRLAGSFTDITARKSVEEQLLHDAFHDPLTGLPNRAFFVSLLDRAMKRTRRRPDYLFAVLFVDFDRFKLVNDSFGHSFGDRLLVAASQRLKACLRPGDVVARLGGDEFTILLDDIKDLSDATRVADRIQQELKAPFELEGHEVFTTASIGIALSTAQHDRPEYHLRDADLAMYRAKARGRACYEMFDEGLHAQAVAQLQLETDLRRALERAELRVCYQPIVDLRNGLITGFEALVRWQHPERGLVSPGQFIPIAEETGLIVPIGRWVMETACRQTAAWQRRFTDRPLSISVNLSARHFQDADLVQQILDILRLTELPATSLKLEITESVLMDDPESHVAVIAQLRKAGVQVQIDDFGTGYSSLSYLQRFSIDALKIDRSFINAGQGEESWDIVQTIVTLARDLGVHVIAEGVETVEQTNRLKALACDQAQGYLFREPVDAAAAEAMLLQQWQRASGVAWYGPLTT